MGKIVKGIGDVVTAPFKAVGNVLGGALDVPILGDVLKFGSNFIPGVGPMVSMGLNVLDGLTGNEARSPIQQSMMNGFRPQGGTGVFGAMNNMFSNLGMGAGGGVLGTMNGFFGGPQGQQTPSRSLNIPLMNMQSGQLNTAPGGPESRYFEPYATQSDYNLSGEASLYGDRFRAMSDQFGGYQDRAFDIYEQSMGPEGGLDWDKVGGIANRMAEAQNRWMTQGTANTQGSVQGDIAAALKGSIGAGFKPGGGVLGNALTNTFSRIGQENLASADRNLGLIGGIEQGDLASQRQAAIAGLQNFTGAQLGAMESAYGADMAAGEIPFSRSLARYDQGFKEKTEPYILKSLGQATKSWGQRQLEDLASLGLHEAGGWIFDNFGNIISSASDFFGGGGGEQDSWDWMGNPWISTTQGSQGSSDSNPYQGAVDTLMPWMSGPFGGMG